MRSMHRDRPDPSRSPAKLAARGDGKASALPAREEVGEIEPAYRRGAPELYYLPIAGLTLLSAWWAMGRLADHGTVGLLLLALYLVCVANALVNVWPTLLGVVVRPLRDRCGGGAAPQCRTAVIMAVRHEPVALVFGAMRDMAHNLGAASGRHIEFVVLSDSTDPSCLEEEWAAAQADESKALSIGYRRRSDPTGHKAGNVLDFCRSRQDLDYVVVLDADSFMSASLLMQIIDLIDGAPGVAIVQTTPRILGDNTALGRWQEFTDALYSPEWSRGLSWWQGDFANYWGHNAIVRVKALLNDGILPVLPGSPPLGGEILLSHDPAEAAMLAKAGWGIRLLANKTGSWEGSPSDLKSTLDRERRWCEGNLQLINLIITQRLKLSSVFHLTAGALYYVAITASLLLRLGGLVLAYQGDIATALLLVVSIAAIRIGGKAVSLALAMLDAERRRSFGGAAGMVASFLADVVLTWFFSIVFTVCSSRALASVLAGSLTKWERQERFAREGSWMRAWRDFGDLALVGAGLVGGGFAVSAGVGIATLVLFGGLIIAPLMAMFTSSTAAGIWLARHAIFVVRR